MFCEEDCVMSQGLSVSVEGFQRVTSLLLFQRFLLCDSAFFHFLWSLVFCSRNLHVKWNWEKRFIWSMLLEKYYLHICLGYTSSSIEFLILIFFLVNSFVFTPSCIMCFLPQGFTLQFRNLNSSSKLRAFFCSKYLLCWDQHITQVGNAKELFGISKHMQYHRSLCVMD